MNPVRSRRCNWRAEANDVTGLQAGKTAKAMTHKSEDLPVSLSIISTDPWREGTRIWRREFGLLPHFCGGGFFFSDSLQRKKEKRKGGIG